MAHFGPKKIIFKQILIFGTKKTHISYNFGPHCSRNVISIVLIDYQSFEGK